MGMRIESSGSANSAAIAGWQQRQQGFKNLMSALQSGDLASAQKAYAAVGAGQGAGQANSPLAQIGKALQSGDIAGAQKLAQQMQAQRAGHHHHHGQQGVQTASASVTAASAAGSATSASGSLLNVVA